MNKIKVLILGFLFVAATANSEPLPLGTVDLVQQYEGVTIKIPVDSTLDVKSSSDKLSIALGLDVNLGEVQSNFKALVKTFDLPTDNCAGYGESVVAKLDSASLSASGNQAVIKAKARVTVWECQKGLPGGGTTVRWKLKCWKVLGKKYCTKIPQTVTIQPGSDIKTKLVEDDVSAKVELLVSSKDGTSFEITPTNVNVELHNDITKFLNKIAAMFNVSANHLAKGGIEKVVNAGMLKKAIPEEFLQYNPKITALSFYTRANGDLGLKMALTSELTGDQLTKFVHDMLIPANATPAGAPEGATGITVQPSAAP